jgi:excisionase family DNA binding protein
MASHRALLGRTLLAVHGEELLGISSAFRSPPRPWRPAAARRRETLEQPSPLDDTVVLEGRIGEQGRVSAACEDGPEAAVPTVGREAAIACWRATAAAPALPRSWSMSERIAPVLHGSAAWLKMRLAQGGVLRSNHDFEAPASLPRTARRVILERKASNVTRVTTTSRSSGDVLITRAHAARLLQVSPSTVARWATHGLLPFCVTLGGQRRYPRSALLAIARQMQAHAPSPEPPTPAKPGKRR